MSREVGGIGIKVLSNFSKEMESLEKLLRTGRVGRVGKSKVLQEVLADLKIQFHNSGTRRE